MPIFGNNQIDDSSRAWVIGRTCNLRIGVYLSGCLRDLVPLRGKGMSDRLPVGITGDWGEGLTRSSVGSSSGSALGPSGSAGIDCSQLETSAGRVSGSVSTSGLSVKSADNFWSGPEGDSNGASNTASDTSGRAGLAVKDSSLSTGSSVMLGISIWGSAISVTGARSGTGGGYPPDRAQGVECLLYSTSDLGGLTEKSVFLGLDIVPGGQPLSSCVTALQNQGSRASICPHAQSRGLPGGDVGSYKSLVPSWLSPARDNG